MTTSILDLVSGSFDKTSEMISENLEKRLKEIKEEQKKLSTEELTIVTALKLFGKDPNLQKFNFSFLKTLISLLEKKTLSKADLIERMKEFQPFDVIKTINWLIDNKYLSFDNEIISIGFKFPNLHKYVSKANNKT